MMLAGIRVVECSQVLSAPYAGMILADLGAEVIKVEKPPGGDEARNMGPSFRNGASMTFHEVNRNKQSVVIDIKSADGHAQLLALVATADIFIHNFRPGDAARLGLDGATLTGLFPRLIYCEMGAFGHKGPRRLEPGYESLLQAYGGLIGTNGTPGAPAARIPASVVDQGTGMWTVIAALAALQRRQASGRGALVNTSLLETAVAWSAPRIHEWVNEGRAPVRLGTGHPNLVP
jgi:crotonobetainyl-CoA:carnitine CoA-transferase CaiB-like acyl-CoA transferase